MSSDNLTHGERLRVGEMLRKLDAIPVDPRHWASEVARQIRNGAIIPGFGAQHPTIATGRTQKDHIDHFWRVMRIMGVAALVGCLLWLGWLLVKPNGSNHQELGIMPMLPVSEAVEQSSSTTAPTTTVLQVQSSIVQPLVANEPVADTPDYPELPVSFALDFSQRVYDTITALVTIKAIEDNGDGSREEWTFTAQAVIQVEALVEGEDSAAIEAKLVRGETPHQGVISSSVQPKLGESLVQVVSTFSEDELAKGAFVSKRVHISASQEQIDDPTLNPRDPGVFYWANGMYHLSMPFQVIVTRAVFSSAQCLNGAVASFFSMVREDVENSRTALGLDERIAIQPQPFEPVSALYTPQAVIRSEDNWAILAVGGGEVTRSNLQDFKLISVECPVG